MSAVYWYIRCSTDKQDLGLQAQRDALQRYSDWRNLPAPAAVFQDEAVSGGTELASRPAGGELCRKLRKGDQVLAVKVDRLWRNVPDALTTAEGWDKRGVAFHIVDLGGQAVTTSSASGWLIFTLLVTLAAFEKLQVGERTRAGMRVKAERGECLGPVPFGFAKMPDGKLRPIPGQLAEVRTMVAKRAAGETFAAIAADLTARKVRSKNGGRWDGTTVRGIILRAQSINM